ncbi:MAG: hypothetical protein RLZ51_1615 [Pseudomonadota bacterium]
MAKGSISGTRQTLIVLLLVLALHGLGTLGLARLPRAGSPAPEPASQVVVSLQPPTSQPLPQSSLQPQVQRSEKTRDRPDQPRSEERFQEPTESVRFDPKDIADTDSNEAARSDPDSVAPESSEPRPLEDETRESLPFPSEALAEPATPAQDAPTPKALPELAQGRSLRLFRVYYGDYTAGQPVARLRLELEVSGSAYVLRSMGEAEGLMSLFYSGTLVQESRGQLLPQGLAPQQYSDIRGSRRERTVRFDHQQHQLLRLNAPPVTLPEGTQDRLSVLYQLGLMVQGQAERFLPGEVVDLPVAGFIEVRRERFQVIGEDVLMVGNRSHRSLHLKRPALPGGRDPSVEVWLGYDAGLQPVRIRLEDAKGQVLDQVIDEP